MKEVKVRTCRIVGCDQPVAVKKAQLCQRCYSSYFYWRKKPPSYVVERAKKLKLWRTRLNEFFPTLGINGRRKKS